MYGIVLLMAAIAYFVLQSLLVQHEGADSALAAAIGGDVKGKLSPVLYAIAIGLSFVAVWIADLIYLAVALMWFLPDPRIETVLEENES